ncbi:hypothetical protein APED_28255 [Acanthopleuribacter pedis]
MREAEMLETSSPKGAQWKQRIQRWEASRFSRGKPLSQIGHFQLPAKEIPRRTRHKAKKGVACRLHSPPPQHLGMFAGPRVNC